MRNGKELATKVVPIAAIASMLGMAVWVGSRQLNATDTETTVESLTVTETARSLPGALAEDEIVGTKTVYVTGAVNRPGMYELPRTARAWDAVVAAGGETDAADLELLNLAEALEDGQHIVVPERAETDEKEEPREIVVPEGRPRDVKAGTRPYIVPVEALRSE